MSECRFEGYVLPGGKFKFADKIRTLLDYLTGRYIRITIAIIKPRRSNKQNRYYWGVVIPYVHQMFLEAGNDVGTEEVHEFLKQHVGNLEKVITMPDGRRRVVAGSTAELETMEFEVYLEKIRAWAAGFGTIIPLPNEVMEDSNNEQVDLSEGQSESMHAQS